MKTLCSDWSFSIISNLHIYWRSVIYFLREQQYLGTWYKQKKLIWKGSYNYVELSLEDVISIQRTCLFLKNLHIYWRSVIYFLREQQYLGTWYKQKKLIWKGSYNYVELSLEDVISIQRTCLFLKKISKAHIFDIFKILKRRLKTNIALHYVVSFFLLILIKILKVSYISLLGGKNSCVHLAPEHVLTMNHLRRTERN